MQELKSSGCCGFSIQSEAGGQLGVVRAAVSWEWLPGAPSVSARVTWPVHGENSSCGSMGTACFCGRVASVFGHLRDLLPAGQQKNMGIFQAIYTLGKLMDREGCF